MNNQSARGVLTLLDSVNHDEILEAMVDKRQSCSKTGGSSANDQDSGADWHSNRHAW